MSFVYGSKVVSKLASSLSRGVHYLSHPHKRSHSTNDSERYILSTHSVSESPEKLSEELSDDTANASSSEASFDIEEHSFQLANLSFASFSNQASGHSNIYSVDEDKIAKPCNPHERDIYLALMDDPILARHVPHYYGVVVVDPDDAPEYEVRSFQKSGEFIVLENLTTGYKQASVMDLKLGTRGWEDEGVHTEHEIMWRRIKANATTSAKLGFRLSGMRVYQPATGDYLIRRSRYGNRLKSEALFDTIRTFLSDGSRVRVEIIPRLLLCLTRLYRSLKENSKFNFMASSLLIIYESDYPPDRSDRIKVDARLIDFDHAEIRPFADSSDQSGVVKGIRNICSLLRKLQYSTRSTQSTLDLPRFRQEFDEDIAASLDESIIPISSFPSAISFADSIPPSPISMADSVPPSPLSSSPDKYLSIFAATSNQESPITQIIS